MRFAERLKKVVRDNFVDIAPSHIEGTAAPQAAVSETVHQNGREAAAPPATYLPFLPDGSAQGEAAALSTKETAKVSTDFHAESGALQKAADVETGENEIVSETGAVNFDRLFDAASSPFTAAQAAEMIAALPVDLPLRVKRLTIKASVDELAKASQATATDVMQAIVADAAQKMLRVARLQETVSEQAAAQKVESDRAVARLQAENEAAIALLRASKEEENQEFCQQTEQEAARLREAQVALSAQIAELQTQIAEKSRILDEVTARNEAAVAAEAAAKALILQAETEAQAAHCEQAEKRSEAVRRACRQRMNALNDIVLFFDEAAMASVPAASPENEDTHPLAKHTGESDFDEELPAFLREDTAAKLLGIKKAASPVHSTR